MQYMMVFLLKYSKWCVQYFIGLILKHGNVKMVKRDGFCRLNREVQNSTVGQTDQQLPSIHTGARHARGDQGSRHQGEGRALDKHRVISSSRLNWCSSCSQMILSRQYGSDGRFTFTSHTPGEHQICLHSNSTKMALFAGGTLVSDAVLDNSEIRDLVGDTVAKM